MTITWHLLVIIGIAGHPAYPYPEVFATEQECEYAGSALKQRAKEKGFWRIEYLCWHPGKPPTRKMGGR